MISPKMMRQARTWGPAILFAATVAFVYLAFGTGYRFLVPHAPFSSYDYFGMLASGFLHGHTYLPLKEPLLDMSLYDGHVYLYWGPFSAVPHLHGLELFCGYYTIAYATLGCVLFMALLRRLGDTGSAAGTWSSLPFCYALAFGSPVLFIVARSAVVYHECIALSFLLQCAAFVAVVRAMTGGPARVQYITGLLLGAAVATRLSNLMIVPVFLAFTLSAVGWKAAIRMSLPILATGMILAGYNYARFGKPTEFGVRYSLESTGHHQFLAGKQAFFSSRYIPLNFRQYFLTVPSWHALRHYTEPRSIPVPASIRDLRPDPERPLPTDIYSIALTMPILWLGLGGLFLRGKAAQAFWLIAGCAAMLTGFLLFYNVFALRFEVDVVAPLFACAYLGFVGLRQRLDRSRRLLDAICVVLAAIGIYMHWQWAELGASRILRVLILHRLAGMPVIPWQQLMPCALLLSLLGQYLFYTRSKSPEAPEPATK